MTSTDLTPEMAAMLERFGPLIRRTRPIEGEFPVWAHHQQLVEQEARTARPLLVVRRLEDDVADVVGHLDYLLWAWTDLVEYRLHGTERPWTEQTSAPEAARAAARALAREELLERTGLAPGQRPAPLRVDVLDDITAVVAATSQVVQALREVLEGAPGVPAFPQGLPPALDARPWLLWMRQVVAVAHQLDERTGPWALEQLAPLVQRVARTLGDVVEGQALAGLCPWCGGRTQDGQEGARTLRVRYPELGAAGEPLVVCSGRSCDPPAISGAFRTALAEPCWPQEAWAALAERLYPLP